MMSIFKHVLRPSFRQGRYWFTCLSSRNFSVEADETEREMLRFCMRGIPKTAHEMSLMLRREIDSPPDSRLLKVAVIGVPNSGKSTLINGLMRWRVCSVSAKVHTTKFNARAIFHHDSTQLVFLDTPGIVTQEEVNKHNLQKSFLVEAEKSLLNADLMAVVHDMSNHYSCNELHPKVLRLLALYPDIPSILILNKLDVFKSKRRLLDAVRFLTEGIVDGKVAHIEKERNHKVDKEILIQKALRKGRMVSENQSGCLPENTTEDHKDQSKVYSRLTEHEVQEFIKDRKGWSKFQEVFMISALQGLGVDDLRHYLLSKAYSSPWLFSSQVVTDQNPEEIALMTVREKFLETFSKEIPYTLRFDIELWDVSEQELNISVRVGCKREGLKKFIIGPGGYRISNITREAEDELRRTFRTHVSLRINIEYDSSLKKN